MITFTRKACKEIQDRLKDPITGQTPPVQVNTFHSWAIRFLQSREIRDLTQRQKVTVWDRKEQKAQMGDACMRAKIDCDMLPMVLKCLGLPAVEGESAVDGWLRALRTAFDRNDLQACLLASKLRGTDRVTEVIKELLVPETAEEEDDAAQSAAPQEGVAEQKNLAANYDKMAAAPGAAQLPGARIKHVAAKRKRSGKSPTDDIDSGDEDAVPGQEHLLDKRRAEGAHWVDEFFSEDIDSNVSTWTLVAKELLQTYLCQEVGIEVLMALGDGAGDRSADQDARRDIFRSTYMYFGKMKDGSSKLDKRKLLTAVRTILIYGTQYLSWYSTVACIKWS